MTLADRVNGLEQRVDNNHQELQTQLEILRTEFLSMHTGMMEKVDILLQNWASQEKDRKDKKVMTEKDPASLQIQGPPTQARGTWGLP